jgi:putative cardiolipin synthase
MRFRALSELLIVSPYFVPSEDGRRHLAEMRVRGVRVAVLTNSLASTDSPAAHTGYARHRAALLGDGVELYETRPEPGAPHTAVRTAGDMHRLPAFTPRSSCRTARLPS